MKCMDLDLCRTFSDANDGNACLGELHSRAQPAAARERLVSQCTQCGGGAECSTTYGQAEIIPYLPSMELQDLSSCGLDACTIDGFLTECADVSPALDRFSQCI
jgi:hypothetical protein